MEIAGRNALITGGAHRVGKAITMEETIHDFYVTAAEQSKGLMADVPRAFSLVARKRNDRIDELKKQLAEWE